jgi:hypothetical protein
MERDEKEFDMNRVDRSSGSRRWTTPAVLVVASLAFLAGIALAPANRAIAEVTEGEKREAFKDGGVLANSTLQESLVVLKRLDQRVERIEKALLEVVK